MRSQYKLLNTNLWLPIVTNALWILLFPLMNELGLLSQRHNSGHLGTHRTEDFVSRSHLQLKQECKTATKYARQ